ncbi:DUF4190 domain-containing protein [Streptomyces sp. NPDC049687]|uniref:DUF4190 domain-containing protein n=1 Tax=Streptomyces sp. NPDC049687 TaxID=3365596 RepID=UPI0037AF2D32
MSIPPSSGSQQPQNLYPSPQVKDPNPHPQGPQVPHPHPPYQVWGQGYAPFAGPAPVNGVAIAALVLGLLCFLPAVGLVLGIIALVQIKKRGEHGKGMAIGGAVVSCLGLALWAVWLFTNVVSDAWEGFVEDTKGSSTYSLAKGECFDVPGMGFDQNADHVDTVSCNYEHNAEVFGTVPLSDGDYPGHDYVTDKAEDECWTLQDTYAMDHWRLTDKVDVNYLTPTAESWAWSGNKITCVFTHTGAYGWLNGPLRRDESILDADQLAFLKAMNAVDEVLYEEPEEDAEEDLDANKDWAADVRDVLGEQADALRGHTWPGNAERSVDALVEDMQDARADWAKAATAGDADTYRLHYDNGYEYVDGDTTVGAREALGLAITPPSRTSHSPVTPGRRASDRFDAPSAIATAR